MGFAAYRSVLRIRDVRRVLLLGIVVRVPMWAGGVILTLHVVTTLHRAYGPAGALAGIATVAATISAPWRGRLLDRVGLRRAIAPSLAVLVVCWSVAPFVGYWPLLVLAFLANLFMIPSFTIVRQSLIHSVPDSQRKSALSIDSVAVEISFMIGPALGVFLVTTMPTSWALFGCEFAAIGGGVLIWFVNPVLRGENPDGPSARAATRTWMSAPVMAVLAMSLAATLVLTGCDVGIVAALRHLHHASWIGWELAVWGLGSAVGGVVYGAVHRTVSLPFLLALLSITALPVVLAPDASWLAVLLFVAGLPCAPTITASVEALSRVVPERARGEALGWHGSAMTAGGAIGAPLAGVAIDSAGWHGGFLLPAVLGLGVAFAGGALLSAQTRRPPADRTVVEKVGV